MRHDENMPRTLKTQQGFTLVEIVVAIVVMGIVAAMVGMFIRQPIEAYFDIERRAGLVDAADIALRRMGRDLHQALPNSVRIGGGGLAVEFLSVRSGGRYRAEPPGNVLDFSGSEDVSAAGVTGSFDVIGPAVNVAGGDAIVVYNLGNPDLTGTLGTDAYEGDNRRSVPGTAAEAPVTTLTFTATAIPYPFASPGRRFQVVDTPVSYVCDLAARTLTRYWGYAISLAQAVPPTGGSSAVLAENITGCNFDYAAGVTQRSGMVALRLTLSKEGEAVSLYHEVHVNNAP